MRRCVVLLAVVSLVLSCSRTSVAADPLTASGSVLLQAFADGIGDLTFASPEWVEAAQEALTATTAKHADSLSDLGEFTLCEVAHNPPAYLHADGPLAFNIKFNGAHAKVRVGELPADQCDLKIQGDHSIMSNLAHIQYHGRDPAVVAAAQARQHRVGRWETDGSMPKHQGLHAVLRSLHDTMAVRTMPRLIWFTPEWTYLVRHIVSTRSEDPTLNEGLEEVNFTFTEVFYDPPKYASPDGVDGGFWVHCNHGQLTIGSGPLPKELEPANYQSRGSYIPILPVGRTVNPAMTEPDKAESAEYLKTALGGFVPPESEKDITPADKKPFPKALGNCMSVLHDELSKRTSGELPSDYVKTRPEWSIPQAFDRSDHYDPSWVLYDKFDMYGEPL